MGIKIIFFLPHYPPRMRYKVVTYALAAAVVALLCVISFLLGTNFTESQMRSGNVELPNGDNVTCVYSETGDVDCNWSAVNL
jgi:hypothetical protein